jgi:hypothetical protein
MIQCVKRKSTKARKGPYLSLIIQRRHRRLRVRNGPLGFGEPLLQASESPVGGGIGSFLRVKERIMMRDEERRQWGRWNEAREGFGTLTEINRLWFDVLIQCSFHSNARILSSSVDLKIS